MRKRAGQGSVRTSSPRRSATPFAVDHDTQPALSRDRADARDRLDLLDERQSSEQGGPSWEATSGHDSQEAVLELLDRVAESLGLPKNPQTGRRLQTFALPADHGIGTHPEEHEGHLGGRSPVGGVSLRDGLGRLLGYILYPLETKADAVRLREHLEEHNHFHNVLVVYPDEGQGHLELWRGHEQLIGGWRRGRAFRDAVNVVKLLSRFLEVREAEVRNPTELAQALAYRARCLRRLAVQQLDEEKEKGSLRELYGAFKQALTHDISESEFADAYAQTVTYCLLAARWMEDTQHGNSAARFTRQSALEYIPAAQPFLGDLFKSALAVELDEQRGRLLWLVDDIAELLERVDVAFVLGAGTPGTNTSADPVIHFYEPFLEAYDRPLKKDLGVFYTPRPVVSFIVRSIDELLRTEFRLEDGLADVTTWGDLIERHGELRIPDGLDVSQPFVQILDPATGTGIFLVEIIGVIHETMVSRWRAAGLDQTEIERLWNAYVPKHLLPRLHGYELLMAPYAIAHLKVSLKLRETGYDIRPGDHPQIFLANTLTGVGKSDRRVHAFTVVVANPPYANYSANLTEEAKAIVDKYRMFAGVPIRERNQLQFERNLQDDFVKFIAVGEAHIQNAGVGVLGYITNATMLASSSLRGMREHLLDTFGSLHVLHLHGGVNERGEAAANDQNVFDIAQAVAVHVYARPVKKHAATVRFSELWGPRAEKLARLSAQSLANIPWQHVVPDEEKRAFVPQDGVGGLERMRMDDVFVRFGAGIKTNRDAVAIAFSEEELLTAIGEFAPLLAKGTKARGCVQRLLYRPFDERVIFYHENVVASRSLPTMQHVLAGGNIGLVASSTWTSPERFSINVSRLLVEMKTGTHDRGTTYFPLFRYESNLEGQTHRVSNINLEFSERWQQATGTTLLTEERGDLVHTVGVRDVLDWIVGLCHSVEYRRRHRALLAQGFPLVFFPKHTGLLRDVAALGKRLIAALLVEDTGDAVPPSFVGDPSARVEKISHSSATIWIDKRRTTGFQGVSTAVWELHVGGYPACEKWLKARKGRPLGKEISHFREVLKTLQLILRLSGEVDDLVAQYGGWPEAFVTKPGAS